MPEGLLTDKPPIYKRAKFWRGLINWGFLFAFIWAFRSELAAVLSIFQPPPAQPAPTLPPNEPLSSFAVLALNCIAGLVFSGLFLLMVSQFVLPVRTAKERGQVFSRLVRFLFNMHGPAVRIREGKEMARKGELRNTLPGVAFVDLSSAVALERQWVGMGQSGSGPMAMLRRTIIFRLIRQLTRWIARRIGSFFRWLQGTPARREPLVRVAGPGIVFTNPYEKIRGVADLRPQFRVGVANVSSRDGFDITTPVVVIFTLGQKPDEFKVTYVDGDTPSCIRALKVDEKKGLITGIEDEFDAADKEEIHRYLHSDPPPQPVAPPPPEYIEKDRGYSWPPYTFFQERVFAALYGRAHSVVDGRLDEGKIINWADLPLRVAIEKLRDILSQEDYSLLYRPEHAHDFPLIQSVRPRFGREVRNLGVLAFRYVRRKDRMPLKKGDAWNISELDYFPVQQLRNSKILRDRGIKVIAASFSELKPVHPGVRGQLVDYWKAGWQQEAELAEADATLDSLRISARARADTQREMIATLTGMFEMPDTSRQALALRVFQALESLAADPKTHALLPRETLPFLATMHKYMEEE